MRKHLKLSSYLLLFTIFLLPFQNFGTEASGLQIIGELPEDHSLLNKLQTLSNEERSFLSPEYESILMQLKARIDVLRNGGFFIQSMLHEELTPEEALLIFGPCLGIDNYLGDPYVRAVFAQSFFPEFYFTRFSERTKVDPENYFNETELEEIHQTAKEILRRTSCGDHLISLGQSPAYIVEALEELVSDDETHENFRIIYKVPCSGAPDYCCLNTHYKGLQLSNVTTPKSLAYYKQVLRDIGVCPLQLGSDRNIYVIDLIGTGGSIASFLKILVSWYGSLGVDLPEIRLLDISVENRNFRNETRVILPIVDNCQIHIDRLFIHTTAYLSDKLDYTEGEDRIIPPFGALQWKPEYERVYKQYPNNYGRAIIECVRRYVEKRLYNSGSTYLECATCMD